MGRKRQRGVRGEPWYRSAEGVWCITLPGHKKQRLVDSKGDFIRGQDNHEVAYKVWHEMMAKTDAGVNKDDNLMGLIFGLYLERHLQPNGAEKTFKDWQKFLQDFSDRWPGLLVKDLTPAHLRTWWAEHPTWGSSMQNMVGTAVRTALNWAVGAESGRLLSTNPLKGMKFPPVRSRGASVLITEEDHQKFLAVVPDDLRDMLLALRSTGTRPSNLWRATAKNFNEKEGILVYDGWNTEPGTSVHKTFKKTGEAMVVPLTPNVIEICKRLAEKHPEGPLFRTAKGGSWNAQKLASRLLWYKKKLKLDHVMCYGYRHSVATDLLVGGVPDAEVAAILGQKSTDMIHKHYGHLGSKIKRLQDTLGKHRS
jgi:integrase